MKRQNSPEILIPPLWQGRLPIYNPHFRSCLAVNEEGELW